MKTQYLIKLASESTTSPPRKASYTKEELDALRKELKTNKDNANMLPMAGSVLAPLMFSSQLASSPKGRNIPLWGHVAGGVAAGAFGGGTGYLGKLFVDHMNAKRNKEIEDILKQYGN